MALPASFESPAAALDAPTRSARTLTPGTRAAPATHAPRACTRCARARVRRARAPLPRMSRAALCLHLHSHPPCRQRRAGTDERAGSAMPAAAPPKPAPTAPERSHSY
ncbi:hypothetical protein GGX14DRAFT_566829 [Mycena pura]|uniref:Uncharacterized protein n=1 Tax=Mycena pura TaxID=153505 RepID=A0AAD6VFY5_9AGAR|nr:hypothetical protein GGX14DRAFT_566829 [Mycena pura]